MPRPCEQNHPLSPDACKLCRLYLANPRYRAKWDNTPIDQPGVHSQPAQQPIPKQGRIVDPTKPRVPKGVQLRH